MSDKIENNGVDPQKINQEKARENGKDLNTEACTKVPFPSA